MKLRYQMRGLGIGIVVTALLMGLSRDKLPLSDAEIKVRALELGMVESNSMKLSDILNTSDSPQGEVDNDNGGFRGIDAVPIGDGADGQETEDGEEGSGAAPAGEDSEGDSTGDEGNPEAEESGNSEDDVSDGPEDGASLSGTASSEAGDTVTVVIESGVTSYSVCQKLQELGLVEDAAGFDDYLCDIGYSRSIRDGTYEIPHGATEEEIAKIITRK